MDHIGLVSYPSKPLSLLHISYFAPAGLADSRVLVLGATSYSDSLDPALRREGRLNREICLDIPDQQARER